MTDNIFDPNIDANENDNEDLNPMDLLVGEGKKFKDVEALARGKLESDRFIERLQEENRLLRQNSNARQNLEELVSKLGKSNVSTSAPTSDGLESPIPEAPVAPTINQEQIALIVKNTLMEENTKRSHSENLKLCASEMNKLWGSGWVEKLKQVGNSLGMSEAYMDTLAKTAPKALLTIVKAQAPQSVSNDIFAAPRSTATVSQNNQSSQYNAWNNYEKLRKENPRKYYSGEVQAQLHKDVLSGKVVLPSN